MRRTSSILVLTLVSVLLTALPALAEEAPVPGVQTDESEINGIVLALILGVIVGAYLFIDAYRAARSHEPAPMRGGEQDQH